MDKLAIMQPYFFPYLGYFSLIKYTNKFIFFDTPQYIKKGWINRNRVLNDKGKWDYITVPVVKSARETPINKIEINNTIAWREKIIGQLTVYKRKAPYYNKVMELVKNILNIKSNKISKLAEDSIKNTCRYLNLNLDSEVFSEMNIKIENVNNPDEWALNISKTLKYSIYVNLPGGINFFDPQKYKNNNIKLEFLETELRPYIQKIGYFEPALSIIDVMMFCDTKEILDMLDEYKIIEI